MRLIVRAFQYFKYSREANTPELRKEARDAATLYYRNKPIQFRTIDNIIAFRRSYVSIRCHAIAKNRLNSK